MWVYSDKFVNPKKCNPLPIPTLIQQEDDEITMDLQRQLEVAEKIQCLQKVFISLTYFTFCCVTG
jgi:hypothetical protein